QSLRVGGCRIAPLIAGWPRGSSIRKCRRWSRCAMKCRRFSFIVSPGIGPMPSTTTRVGIPSVWESIALTARTGVLTSAGSDGRARGGAGLQRPLGVPADDGALLLGEGAARGPGRAAEALARHVDRVLDRLDELGLGVPREDRRHLVEERARLGHPVGGQQ